MIRLYYTGNSKPGLRQTRSDLSLGGYPSTSLVPNGELDALFNEISEASMTENGQEIVFLAVKNEEASEIKDIAVWLTIPTDNLANIEVALALPSVDASGNQVFEAIPNARSVPYNAEFSVPVATSKLTITNKIKPGEYLGIWIRRKIGDVSKVRDNDTLIAMYPSVPATEESWMLDIDYKTS